MFFFLYLLLFPFLTLSHCPDDLKVPDTPYHSCIQSRLNYTLDFLDTSTPFDFEGRSLQSSYENIRIHFDFTPLSSATAEFQDYIINTVIPPAQNFLEAALQVKPLTKNLTTGTRQTICDGAITLPSLYRDGGVAADLVLFVGFVNEPNETYVAFSVPCTLDTSNNRPLFGRIAYNIARIFPGVSDAVTEANIVVTLHEITHSLGFNPLLFGYFIDPTTNVKLQNHTFNKTVNGVKTSVINVEPLTTRLQTYFNCSTIDGAYLENEGVVGSAGYHFERRIFYNEYMTATNLVDSRITAFTLALLEGSGWYQVNYSLAESMTWGKNEGCTFLDTTCVNKQTQKPNFNEFCGSITDTECSWTWRGASVCGASTPSVSTKLISAFNYWGNYTVLKDQYADNCPIFNVFGNKDCEDTNNKARALLVSSEFYGYGGKCFKGTLAPLGKTINPYFYCFKTKCDMQASGDYYLNVTVGKQTAVCKSAENIKVSGFAGTLFCPDPNAFCNQMNAEGFCRRGCSGRGTCVEQECQCLDGWTHFDCSRREYVDNCVRCAGQDILRTSCYGDTCDCNPNNSTCVDGIANGLVAVAEVANNETNQTSGLGDNLDLEIDLSEENLNKEDIFLWEQNESENTQSESLNEEDFFGLDDMINGMFSTSSAPALSDINGFFFEQLGDIEQKNTMSGTRYIGLQLIGLSVLILCLFL